MPNSHDVQEALKKANPFDVVRKAYLDQLHVKTGRNVIAYYSGWLQKPNLAQQGVSFEINDSDKNGFMSAIHGLDKSIGLDLILHTPGGSVAALESLVDYLRAMFSGDIRAIVPQIAMSAGTMLALACREIVMGKHSNLGPIDPNFGGTSAHAVIEEFKRAGDDIAANPMLAHLWHPIISKYPPTFVGECKKVIAWADQIVEGWLKSGMFEGDADAAKKAKDVVAAFGDHGITLSHERHIPATQAANLGVKIVFLEGDQELQDRVLSVHHAFIQTLSDTAALKIIENHKGVASIPLFQIK